MKFEIHNAKYEDSFVIAGDDIEEIRERVKAETRKRGWEDEDCYSVQLSGCEEEEK